MRAWILSSSVLIIAVVLLRRLLGKRVPASLRYGLWLLVLLRLLIPGSVFQSRVSVMNLAPAQSGAVFEPPMLTPSPQAGGVLVGTVPGLEPAPDNATAPRYGGERAGGAAVTGWRDWLVTLWVCGSALTAAAFIVSNGAFYLRLRGTRRRFEADFPLPVYVSGATASPCLFGYVRPAVYLTPAAAESPGLPYVLAHELAQKMHGDIWWSLLRCCCLAAWWWNPLVWLAAFLSRKDGEIACDEAAIRSFGEDKRIDYCDTLVDMIALRPAPVSILRASTAMVAGKRGLRERLEAIVKRPKTYVSAIVALALIAALAAGCTFTGAKETPAPPEDTSTPAPEGSGFRGGPYYVSIGAGVLELRDGSNPNFTATGPGFLIEGLPGTEGVTEGELSAFAYYGILGDGFGYMLLCSYPAAGLCATDAAVCTDGGKGEWTRISTPEGGAMVTAAAFVDRNTGYVCCRSTRDNGPEIHQTTDGGKSWSRMKIALPPELEGYVMTAHAINVSGEKTEFSVRVHSNNTGSAAGTVYYGGGGGTWDWRGLEVLSENIAYSPESLEQLPDYGTDKLIKYYVSSDGAYADGAISELCRRLKDETLDTLWEIEAAGEPETGLVCKAVASWCAQVMPELEIETALDAAIESGEGGATETALRIKLLMHVRTYSVDVFPADLDRDGEDEYVSFEKTGEIYHVKAVEGGEPLWGGRQLWSCELALAHPGWGQVYVTRWPDSEYRLLVYTPTMYQGYAAYAYSLYSFENGVENIVAGDSVEFSINGDEPIDAHALAKFADELNEYLEKSYLIISTTGGEFKGPGTELSEMYEDYDWLYEAGLTYEPGETLQQRIQKYSDHVNKS